MQTQSKPVTAAPVNSQHNLQLSVAMLKVLSSSIYHFMRVKDNPPAQEMQIPISQIRQDKKDATLYTAQIKYIVDYCGIKENTVKICFNVDAHGRFIQNSWKYVDQK